MENTQVLLNIVWTMVGAFLVYFMQAGFAMVETGFTRAKNSGNILMKNMMDFVLGSIFFFIIGFALMFGGSNAFIGTAGFFHPKSLADADGMFNGLPIGVFMIFQTVFCATSATIVSGAMAERTKFISYLIYSAAISIFIYPITGHWIWGGGWLSQIGFHDFAGSTAVHMVGGLCALAGAKMVGPRIGKYTKEGKPVAIPGHNLPLGRNLQSWRHCHDHKPCGSSSNTCYPDCYLGTLWKTGYQYDNERRTGRTGSYYSKL